jgi:DNA-directed RNA polymerase subunit M/transcription elongation factor TFIIS
MLQRPCKFQPYALAVLQTKQYLGEDGLLIRSTYKTENHFQDHLAPFSPRFLNLPHIGASLIDRVCEQYISQLVNIDKKAYTPPSYCLMFCPNCGTLGFVNPSNNLNCSNYQCGYSGSAINVIRIDSGEVDLSQIRTQTKEGEYAGDIRENGGPMSSSWDEPSCRLQSTEKRKCPDCHSQNLRIICSEEECLDCGAHVP